MQAKTEIQQGWEFMAQMFGADAGSRRAFSDFIENAIQNESIQAQNAHIQQINDAIDQLAKNINEHPHINMDVEQFKGFVAEEMHAGTFNIDAIRQGSEHRAWTLQDNGYASVDVETNFGKEYSLKYSNTAKDAENMQAALNADTQTPKYQGQERLIAAEQVDEAKAWAHRRGLRDIANRPSISNLHMDTEEHLVGKISDGEGVESKELSINESKQIAREAKKGGFDPDKHGFSKDPLIDEVRIKYVNQAMKAGLTAAAITAITQIVPELYKAIDYLIKHGEIDLDGLKKSGKKVISTSGEAFLKGSIAYGVEMAIQNGVLGEALKQVNPSIVGVAVTVVFGTIKDSILVAAGKMSSKEMGMHFVDTVVVSSGYLVSMKIGGAIAQILFPELPGIGFAIGSLLGCSVAVVYNIGKKKLISFCVDTGFTCFGLVEQNYELPEEVLHEMGVETIPVLRTQVERIDVPRTQIMGAGVETSEYETIDITVLRRGVIGVNKIGYVPC